MPSSPNRRLVLEASRRRSVARASPLSLVDAAGVKESGVVDRDLTLEEAAALVVADLPSAMGASIYKPETLKRNAILLRKYERVTKRATIDLAGIELYVRAVLRVQAHRRGLGRPTTTAESVIDNTCRVIARVWRMQNRALSIPSDMAFALQGFQKEALRTLTRSSRTVEFCDDLAFLFMRALAQGSRRYYETCFVCCALVRVGSRVGMFQDLTFGRIRMVRDITKDENRSDPKKHLWTCVLLLGYMKDGSEVDCFETSIVGCPVYLGIVDELYYLNKTCQYRIGVPLLDVATGKTMEQRLKEPDLSSYAVQRVYQGYVKDLYKVYKKTFDENTNVPSGCKLRPHGSRTYMTQQYHKLAESGLISPAAMESFEAQLGHSPESDISRQRYLSPNYNAGIYFGGWLSRNPVLTGTFHLPPADVGERVGLPRGTALCVLDIIQVGNLELLSDAFWEINSSLTKRRKNVKYKEFKVHFMRDVMKSFVFGKSAAEISEMFDDLVGRRLRAMDREQIKEYLVSFVFLTLNLSAEDKVAVMNL